MKTTTGNHLTTFFPSTYSTIRGLRGFKKVCLFLTMFLVIGALAAAFIMVRAHAAGNMRRLHAAAQPASEPQVESASLAHESETASASSTVSNGKIVFTNDTSFSSPTISLVDPAVNGSEISLGAGQSPVWKPDGTAIAFVELSGDSNNPTYEIKLMDPDGSHRRSLSTPAFGDAPAWSPDGTMIAFNSTNFDKPGIWVMNADGSHQTQVTDAKKDPKVGAGPDFSPAWQPVTANGQVQNGLIAFIRNYFDSNTGRN